MNVKLKALVSDILGIDLERIEPTLSRHVVDNWDSLNHLRLISAFEEEFAVTLTMDEIQEISTIGDLCEVLKRNAR